MLICGQGRAAWEIFGSVDTEKDGVDGTNGFSFGGADASSFNYALDRALDSFYNDRNWFRSLQVLPSSNPSLKPSLNPSSNPSSNPSLNPSSNPKILARSLPQRSKANIALKMGDRKT
jgi:hypothetical protein